MRLALTLATALFAPPALAAGGAYMSVPAANAEACARACAEDGLCISWTFTEQTCALAAVVVMPPEGVSFGLSDRTPTQFRLRNITPGAAPSESREHEALAVKPAKREAVPTETTPELLGGPIDLNPLQPDTAHSKG